MKRALLVGIDTYENFGDLAGCENDVSALYPLLQANEDGSPNFDCRALLGSRDDVSRRTMLEAVGELLTPGEDVALFYFAGHGIGQTNDVSLALPDGDHVDPGLPLSLLLGKAQNADVKQVIVILDACHSGAGGGHAMLGRDIAMLRPGISILAAARAGQVAKESNGRGLFSTYLSGALEGAAADVTGRITLPGIYAHLAAFFGGYGQRPTLKANLDDAYELRRTRPVAPLEELRELPRIFAAVDTELRLDATYEREAPNRVEKNVRVYDILAKYRDAKLVEFMDETSLYYTAMRKGRCRLSPYGRYYWTLATQRRF